MILLDLPAGTVDATLARLDQFIFTEDVRLESLSEALSSVSIHGPLAAEAITKALRVDGGAEVDRGGGVDGALSELARWRQYQHARFTFGGAPVSIVRIDQIGVPGYCIYLAREKEAECLAALESAGAVVVLPAALEAARIEAGYPVFGVDMTD